MKRPAIITISSLHSCPRITNWNRKELFLDFSDCYSNSPELRTGEYVCFSGRRMAQKEKREEVFGAKNRNYNIGTNEFTWGTVCSIINNHTIRTLTASTQNWMRNKLCRRNDNNSLFLFVLLILVTSRRINKQPAILLFIRKFESHVPIEMIPRHM